MQRFKRLTTTRVFKAFYCSRGVHAGDICHHLKQSSKIKVNLRGGLVIKTLMTPEMIISHPKQI